MPRCPRTGDRRVRERCLPGHASCSTPANRTAQRFSALLTLTAVGWLCASGVSGQAPPEPTFRGGVNVIEVEATVLDGDGRPVAGLTKGDFRIFEDDIQQAIGSFSITAPPPATGGGKVGPVAAVAEADATYAGNTYVLILDSGMPKKVRDVATDFIEFGVRPGDRVAVIATQPGGFVPPTLPLTTDRTAMLARIARTADTWATRTPMMTSGLTSYRVVRDVATRLSAIPGRGKAIVFIGAGTLLLWNESPMLIGDRSGDEADVRERDEDGNARQHSHSCHRTVWPSACDPSRRARYRGFTIQP